MSTSEAYIIASAVIMLGVICAVLHHYTDGPL